MKQITLYAAAWNIPAAEVNELQRAFDRFQSLLEQADSPARNKIIVAEKNAVRKALVEKIRRLVSFRLKNPVITVAQRVAMGLNVRASTYSRVPVPGSRPEPDLEVLDFRRVKLRFRDKDCSTNAHPYGVTGAVVAYDVCATPPTSPTALHRTVLATRTPFVLEFTEEERGQTFYVALCWQNERGEKGPWSEIVSAIVP